MSTFLALSSRVKSALSYVEKAIPSASAAQAYPGDIDKHVTAKVQNFVTPAFLEPLLKHLLADTSASEEQNDGAIIVDDEDELRLGHYSCSSDVQTSLQEFHKALFAQWPVKCNPAHKSMLRLTTHREYEQEDSDGVLAFDTLSSGHDRFWGRITFVLRYVLDCTVSLEQNDIQE